MNPEDIAQIVLEVEKKIKKESKIIQAQLYEQNVILFKANKNQEEIIKSLETIISYYEKVTNIKRDNIQSEVSKL